MRPVLVIHSRSRPTPSCPPACHIVLGALQLSLMFLVCVAATGMAYSAVM